MNEKFNLDLQTPIVDSAGSDFILIAIRSVQRFVRRRVARNSSCRYGRNFRRINLWRIAVILDEEEREQAMTKRVWVRRT